MTSDESTPGPQADGGPDLTEIFDQLLADAGRDLVAATDPLQAELVMSHVTGLWASAGKGEADPEVVLGEGLIAHAEAAGTPEGRAVLLAMAVLGTGRQRELAAAGAQRMGDAGVPAPSWERTIGTAEPAGAWAYGDVFGDQTSVLLGFDLDGARHGLVLVVDHTLTGMAKDAFVGDDPARALDMIAGEEGPLLSLRELTPGEARVLTEPAIARTDRIEHPPVTENYAGTRSLALARLRTLPEPFEWPADVEAPSEAERTTLVEDFLASDRADALGDPDAVRPFARLIVDHSAELDRDPHRVSPAKTEVLLLHAVPSAVTLDEVAQIRFPEIVRAWTEWAGERAGLSSEARAELAASVDSIVEAFPEAYARGGGYPSPDPGPAPGTPEYEETLERRLFAMPHTGAVVGGEEHTDLDPADETQLGLLLLGEHPEYQEALSDPTVDGPVEGEDPRLHIAMHEIVTKQLWDDDPPEAWVAAQRLTAQGLERHEVLHLLGREVMRHLQGAVARGEAVDADAYARDLLALTRS